MYRALKKLLRIPYITLYLNDERVTKEKLKQLLTNIKFHDSVIEISWDKNTANIYTKGA